MEKSYAVSKVKTMLLISGITDYQKMAMEKAAEAETDQEINEAVEYMGVAQGIINTVFTFLSNALYKTNLLERKHSLRYFI